MKRPRPIKRRRSKKITATSADWNNLVRFPAMAPLKWARIPKAKSTLTAADLAAIGRIVEAAVARGLSGRFAGLKATVAPRRRGC